MCPWTEDQSQVWMRSWTSPKLDAELHHVSLGASPNSAQTLEKAMNGNNTCGKAMNGNNTWKAMNGTNT